MSLILIGAHPKTIEYDKEELITKHFWGNEIQSLIEREKIYKPTIETIDILHGGTYQQDIFDNIYVKENQNKYCQIYLLDCGGIWYVLQSLDISETFSKTYESKETRKLRESLILLTEEEVNDMIKEIILKLYSMLKPNGICIFSKFTDLLFQETFINLLNDLGMIYEIENYNFMGTVIIIRKL
jgi:hypothetical protein